MTNLLERLNAGGSEEQEAADYHGRIMNIPLSGNFLLGKPVGLLDKAAYLEGHKDARHAAAEIVLGAAARIRELEQRIIEYEVWLQEEDKWTLVQRAEIAAARIRELEAQLAKANAKAEAWMEKAQREMAKQDETLGLMMAKVELETQLAEARRAYKDISDFLNLDPQGAYARLTSAEAERDRLKAALERIAKNCEPLDGDFYSAENMTDWMYATIREIGRMAAATAALADEAKEAK